MTEQERKDLEAAAYKYHANHPHPYDDITDIVSAFEAGAKFRDEQCEKRIAELESSLSLLRDTIATIHQKYLCCLDKLDESQARVKELEESERKLLGSKTYVGDLDNEAIQIKLSESRAECAVLRAALEKIKWSVENDFGRACDSIARKALQSTSSEALDAIREAIGSLENHTGYLRHAEKRYLEVGKQKYDFAKLNGPLSAIERDIEKLKQHFGG